MPSGVPTIEWWSSLPLLILAATAIVILLVDAIVPQRGPMLSMWLSLLGMLAAIAVIIAYIPPDTRALNQCIAYDTFGRWGAMIALEAGCLIALISPQTIRLYGLPRAEFYALLVFSVFGMAVLSLSLELLTIFLTVEIIAVTIYILAGLRRGSSRSSEAALKYFILSAFSGGFLIFGFVFLYGGAGGNSLLGQIGLSLIPADSPFATSCLALGLALALVGFSFKLTLVPFHLYAADVFEGSPTPVALLLATGSKVAGLVALIHLLTPLHEHIGPVVRRMSADVCNLLWILAALSIVVGNVVALLQRHIKRMLAYSSIAHSGYLLIAVLVFVDGTVARADTEEAMLVYLVAYVVMNATAFGVALTLGELGEGNIADYAGLARRSPGLAFAMALSMLALTGIPATVGFVGKFMVFARAVEAGYVLLVILAVLGSAISAYYYLRVVVYMYMREPATEIPAEPVGLVQGIGLALAAVPVVGFGIFPQSLLTLLRIL
jgi:NADH-quinone oxidoreductase subunit N